MTIANRRLMLMLLVLGAPLAVSSGSEPAAAPIGVVVMHGKGGTPSRYVAALATGPEERGYLVANLEMPWSGARSYDASVAAAEADVESALAQLRAQGAGYLFVAGHSQGGLSLLP